MTRAFTRLVLLALAAGALLPPLVAACTALLPPAEGAPLPSWGPVLASAPLTLGAGVALAWLLRRLEPGPLAPVLIVPQRLSPGPLSFWSGGR